MMTRKERESLVECLHIIYGITTHMQEACQGFEDRLPAPPRDEFEKAVILKGFSLVYVECQKLLEVAAAKLAAELKNVTVPAEPSLH